MKPPTEFKSNDNFVYDAIVSFAGEQREFVESVVSKVKDAGLKVFYDEDNLVDSWGRELTEYFQEKYEVQSRYAIMFISHDYANKSWTRLERRSILARDMESENPYLLPVRFDQTTLPGVRKTVGYLDANILGVEGVAKAIKEKITGSNVENSGQFNGRVPRTEYEASIVVGERPEGWEYLLYSFELSKGIESLAVKYRDYQLNYSQIGTYIETSRVIDQIQNEMATMSGIMNNFNSILRPEVHERAFGAPGESGNVDEILHLANRFVLMYQDFLDWGLRIRGYATDNEQSRELFAALADYVGQSIENIRNFVFEFGNESDMLTNRMQDGEVHLTFTITLEIPTTVTKRFNKALKNFKKL